MIHRYNDALVILLPEICTKKTIKKKAGIVAYACNSSPEKNEAGGWQIGGQPERGGE